MKNKEEVLQNCTIDGNIIKLPNIQLDRKVYQEVAKSLELIGGKWKGGKIFGFVFNTDPTELLEQIANGEKRNLKKEYQFFSTPDNLVEELVQLSSISSNDIILEPSAGQGAIMDVIIKRMRDNNTLFYCEKMPTNLIILDKKYKDVSQVYKLSPYEDDFLKLRESQIANKIIANPPFSNNQDIDHIKHMYSLLKLGGRLVSISSEHWKMSTNKKEIEFKQWLKNVNAEILPINKGVFKESGTLVGGYIIIINK